MGASTPPLDKEHVMQSSRRCTGWSVFLIGIVALGALIAMAAATFAQAPAAPKAADFKVPSQEKRLPFEMRDKPWRQVFAWLSDQTGLPVISVSPPTGTFTFISPRGVDKQPRAYTMAEIIDFLNEGLLAGPGTQQYVLIRRQHAFILMPANGEISTDGILPRVTLDELPSRGKTEIVSVILPLQSLVAEDFQPQVMQIMGPLGKVVAIAKANQLYLQDTVANLQRIVTMVKDIEKNDPAETYMYQCKYIKARDAARTLKNILGDAKEVIELSRAQFAPAGDDSPVPQGGSPRDSTAAPAATKLPRMHYVTCDERTNTVLVSGPADKIALARAMMQKLDVPLASQPTFIGHPPVGIKTYAVPGGNAEVVAKQLQEAYKETSSVRVAPLGTFSIMVYAEPEDQAAIAKRLQDTGVNTGNAEIIALNQLDAVATAKTLQRLFGNAKSGAPSIVADAEINGIVVKGTTGQLAEVKAALQALGEGGRLPADTMRIATTGNTIVINGTTNQLAGVKATLKAITEGVRLQTATMRVITLETGSAATVAQAVQRLLPQMRKNPVKVVDPVSAAEQVAPERPKDKSSDRESTREADGAADLQLLSQLVDPQKNKKLGKKSGDDRPGRPDLPVTITAFGNKLIVTSEDPEALALVQELIHLLTQTQAGEGDFQIIRLKNANAIQTAQVIDELFNGARDKSAEQSASRLGGRVGGAGGLFGAGPLGAGGAAPVAAPRKERIRVVADPATNALLVKASPIDLLTIRSLLGKAIDTGETDSRALLRTWVIGPLKNTRAVDVARVLRDVYHESLNNNPSITTLGGGPFGFFGTQQRGTGFVQNVDANGNPTGVTLSVGVDDQTNTLALHCSRAMYEDIRKLVAQLEKAGADSTRTVRVMSIRGVDPLLVQQAIDSIQGRRTPSANRAGTSGFVPSGTGGFTSPGTVSPSNRSGLFPGGITPGVGGRIDY